MGFRARNMGFKLEGPAMYTSVKHKFSNVKVQKLPLLALMASRALSLGCLKTESFVTMSIQYGTGGFRRDGQ